MSEELKQVETSLAVVNEAKLLKYLDFIGLKNVTNDEKKGFLEIAISRQLNPFEREIYIVKYGATCSILTGYEVYIKRAERTGLLNGWNVTTSGSTKENNLKAIITIFRKDFSSPFVHEVEYSEYKQNNNFWNNKPITMLKKVAISQGFRLCFSYELGGLPYTSDEMPQNESQIIETSAIHEKNNRFKLDEKSFKKGLELLKTDFNKAMEKFDSCELDENQEIDLKIAISKLQPKEIIPETINNQE